MTVGLPDFRVKFDLDGLTVLALEHWTWSVRPLQTTLGTGIFALNRPCTAFGDVTPVEMAEFATLVAAFETRTRALFAPDKFNYMMLMMLDDQVHFHALPRYAKPVTWGGLEWPDKTWPNPPGLGTAPEGASPVAVRDALLAG